MRFALNVFRICDNGNKIEIIFLREIRILTFNGVTEILSKEELDTFFRNYMRKIYPCDFTLKK